MSWLTTTSILRDLRDDPHGYAWRMFIERFRGPAVRFAMKLGHGPFAAEDVAQEALLAFTTAYRDDRFDRAKGRLSAWLFGFVRRSALAHRRRAERADDPRGGASFFDQLEGGTDRSHRESETSDERAWEGELLRECLALLKREVNDQTWQAFTLTALHDVPAPEVAQQLNVPITVVYNARHRVAKRLREMRETLDTE